MATNQKLFGQFPPVSTERWEEVITADLKGADYDKKLVWRTREGFNVRPYYRAEDLTRLEYLNAAPGEFPYVRGVCKNNHWRIHQTIVCTDAHAANALAHQVLMAGVDSLEFHFAAEGHTAAGLEALLRGIVLDAVEVAFSGCGVKQVAELMPAYLERMGVAADEVKMSFAIDPIINKLTLKGEFTCCADGRVPAVGNHEQRSCSNDGSIEQESADSMSVGCFKNIAELVKNGGKKMRFVTVGGHNFGNAGATIVQELGFMLAVGHEYLVRLVENGLTADRAAHTLRFKTSVSANYFMEIAKLRAARMLWATIVREYKPERACAEKMRIHAESSRWNQTVYDPYVNMLRGTTEAMSAAIGGVHSMEVLPFDAPFEKATEFSSRIARNVQLLLKHESHFDNVTDPSGGSYYVETLTQNIAEQAWKLFQEVEAKGGYIAAFQAGFVKESIDASAAQRAREVATRRTVLLGTNQYPNFNEVSEATPSVAEPVNNGGLTLLRGAQPFEQMRLAVDRSGKNPRVFLLTCGTLGMARARAQFATNFFGCAGFRIEDNTFFASIKEGIDAALKSKAEVVVVCAADDDYAAAAPEVFAALSGKAIVVVAGGEQPELMGKGINNFINVKSNVLETLRNYVKELGL